MLNAWDVCNLCTMCITLQFWHFQHLFWYVRPTCPRQVNNVKVFSNWPFCSPQLGLPYPWVGKIDNRLELSSFPESFLPRLLPFFRKEKGWTSYIPMIVKMLMTMMMMMMMIMVEREISAFVLWSCTMQRTNLNEVCKWIVWHKIHFHQTIINLKAEIQNEPTSATHFLLQILGDVSKLMDQDWNMGKFWKSSWRKVSTTR